MTRYTVVWSPGAAETLASIWINATSKSAVAAASDEIDRSLAVDPTSKGRPYSEGSYWLRKDPLRVTFEVRDLDRIVEVTSVVLVSDHSGNGRYIAP